MSYSFYVPVSGAPNLDEIEEGVADPAWDCPDAPDDGVLADGAACHPFLVGYGARGVELVHERGHLQVRIMTCSSYADHDLALSIVRAVAGDGVLVSPEDGEPMTLAELAARYDAAWIDRQVDAGTSYPLALAAGGQTVELGGPRRSFHLGPRFHGELASGEGGTLGERLIEAMTVLQAIDEDGYFPANVLKVKQKDGEAFTLAVWAPDVSYLFPAVDRFAIIRDDGSSFMIPSAKGPEAAGKAWRWLDEKHALVEGLAGYPWTCVVDVASEHAIPRTETPG